MSDISSAEATGTSVARKGKILGMPRMVFIIVLGIVLGGAYWYYNKRKAAATGGAASATAAPTTGVGSGSASSSSGGGAGGGGGNPANNATSGYATNAMWGAAAVNWLSAQGVAPTDASNAIGNYLNGTTNTAQQEQWVNEAENELGVPPQGVITSTTTPSTPYVQGNSTFERYTDGTIVELTGDGTANPLSLAQWQALGSPKYTQLNTSYDQSLSIGNTATSAGKTAAAALVSSGAPAGSTLYTIQLGDSLQSISQRYFNTPNDWETIYTYNTNKTIIGPNPDLLFAGTVIAIPSA